MSYRNDLDAALARNRALERRLDLLQRRIHHPPRECRRMVVRDDHVLADDILDAATSIRDIEPADERTTWRSGEFAASWQPVDGWVSVASIQQETAPDRWYRGFVTGLAIGGGIVGLAAALAVGGSLAAVVILPAMVVAGTAWVARYLS